MRAAQIAAICLGLATIGCKKSAPAPEQGAGGTTAAAASGSGSQSAMAPTATRCDLERLPTSLPAPRRLVAIGDIHGDLSQARKVMALAQLVDGDRWVGADTVVVQTGDILDRGDDEKEILQWLFSLTEQARAAGGDIVLLSGNHELMNAALDFRYVTPGGFADFPATGDALDNIPQPMRGRAQAFRPGGPWAMKLSQQRVAVKVGDSVFVHGGITASWAAMGLADINRQSRCFLAGQGGDSVPRVVSDPDGPLWTRRYGGDDADCDELGRTLTELGAKRMIIGHTPQLEGVTSACDQRVWRIDVGLAAHYGGPVQALEILGNDVRVLD